MKANELMIGDWIGWLPTWKNDETGEIEWDGDRNEPIIGKVGMLMKDCTTIDYCDESIEVEDIGLIPVPLTPEILEKNGFTKDEGIDQWYFKSNYRLDMGLFAVGIDDGCGVGLCVMRNGAITYFCKYVHELQHYLRLIGGAEEIIL